MESCFGSTEFVHAVEEVSEELVKIWACRFSRARLVLVSAGPPCQGVSGLNASRLGSEHDPRSNLHHHVSRVRELAEKHFSWAETFLLMESVACMSRGVGILPYELDAVGLTPCRRARLFWFNWKIQLEEGVAIETPLTSQAEDTGELAFSWIAILALTLALVGLWREVPTRSSPRSLHRSPRRNPASNLQG